MLSMAMVVIWKSLRLYGFYYGEVDQEIIRVRISDSWLLYTLPGALILLAVYKKFTRSGVSLMTKDKNTFLLYRDQRLPIPLHIYLGALSLYIMGNTMFLNFESELAGTIEVFSTAFKLFIFWVVLIHLDNPTRGRWFQERAPRDWLEDDPDIVFGFEENGEEAPVIVIAKEEKA